MSQAREAPLWISDRSLVEEAVRKLVPSAEADSICSTSDLPELPCRAFTCRRFAAGVSSCPAVGARY